MNGDTVERQERRIEGRLYGRTAADLTGPLQPSGTSVRYHKVLSPRQQTAVAEAVRRDASPLWIQDFELETANKQALEPATFDERFA